MATSLAVIEEVPYSISFNGIFCSVYSNGRSDTLYCIHYTYIMTDAKLDRNQICVYEVGASFCRASSHEITLSGNMAMFKKRPFET